MRASFAPLLVLAILLASAPIALAAVSSVPAPTLAVGNTWSYDVTGGGNATARVDAIENVTIGGGSTIPAYRVVTTFSGGARASETETIWYATSDFAKLRHARTSSAGPSDFTVVAPCVEWRFPMRVGDSWSVSCTLRSGADEFTYTSEWTIVREEPASASIAGGANGSLLARETAPDGSYNLYWFAPGACSYIRTQVFPPGAAAASAPTEEHTLTKQNCGAPASATPTPSTRPATNTTPASTSPATPSPGQLPPSTSTPPTSATVTTPTDDGGPDSRAPLAPWWALVAAVGAAAVVFRRRGD